MFNFTNLNSQVQYPDSKQYPTDNRRIKDQTQMIIHCFNR